MKILVTIAEHKNLLSQLDVECLEEIIYVDEFLRESEGCCNLSELNNEDMPKLQLNRTVKPTDYAYMIYTSGSTGKPKGVICNHIGPMTMLEDSFPSKWKPGKDIVGFSAPLIFDVFVWGFFHTLGFGLMLSLDMTYCTMLISTPSHAPLLLEDKTNNNVHSLMVSGEACTHGLELVTEQFINAYGPTETSILCTISSKSSTIGRPLPNVSCYVVHPDDGTLCPPGVSGELWIGENTITLK
mmetsp:Transcript_30575/g.34334  ORF Transcript_30575/g.34334 Transcript_30575/m.34334 type:complete len:241 (-) Transcript_30575:547-1269(-)